MRRHPTASCLWSKVFPARTVGNLPLNSNCAVTEALPPPPQICPADSVAVWSSTSYAPSQFVANDRRAGHPSR